MREWTGQEVSKVITPWTNLSTFILMLSADRAEEACQTCFLHSAKYCPGGWMWRCHTIGGCHGKHVKAWGSRAPVIRQNKGSW